MSKDRTNSITWRQNSADRDDAAARFGIGIGIGIDTLQAYGRRLRLLPQHWHTGRWPLADKEMSAGCVGFEPPQRSASQTSLRRMNQGVKGAL